MSMNPSELYRDSPLSCRVLLAEDDPITSMSLQILMSSIIRGDLIDTADNGERAFALAVEAQANDRAYDLIISDYQMPACTGSELCSRLRAVGIMNYFVLSSSDELDTIDPGRQLPIDEFHKKPLNDAMLLRAIVNAACVKAAIKPKRY